MSWIKVDSPLAPYATRPGIPFLLPGTDQVFRIEERSVVCSGILSIEIPYEFEWSSFQIHQKIFDRSILVQGRSGAQFIRYEIRNGSLSFLRGGEGRKIKWTAAPSFHSLGERLHLGSFRNVSVDQLRRNASLVELFPIWFALGQGAPSDEVTEEELSSFDWRELFWKETEGAFAPLNEKILGLGYRYIRSRFIRKEGRDLFFLPHLPKEAHAGRIRLTFEGMRVEIEWSRHKIKKIACLMSCTKEVRFQLPFERCRMRRDLLDKGQLCNPKKGQEMRGGSRYLFDQFS